MNWLVKWGVKKWAIGMANTALKDYEKSVTQARALVAKYIARVEALLAFLRSLDMKLADNQISDTEAGEIVAESKQLAKDLVA